MKSESYNDVLRTILSNPDAREVYYQERRLGAAERREREALEQAAEDERQRCALGESRRKEKERLLGMSPADAWVSAHPPEVLPENAATRGELRWLILEERRRLKATRERLREVGIR